MVIAVTVSKTCLNNVGLVIIMVLVVFRSLEEPPSIMYDATVKGAPAKPTNAVCVGSSFFRY